MRRSPLRQAAAQARTLGAVERDAEARARWRHVYPELAAGLPGLAGAITGRAAAQVTRLSLLYALLEGNAVIPLPPLEAALALWRHCAASGERRGSRSLSSTTFSA